MRRRNYLIPAALAFIAAPYAAQALQSGGSDANYHQDKPKTNTPAKPPELAASPVSYPKTALTKIEFLPSSI
jgi:hypothetical protein